MNTIDVVQKALAKVQDRQGIRPIAIERPPLVLDYSIDPDLLCDSLMVASSALDRGESEVSLLVSNVEIELDGELEAGDELETAGPRPGKHLGLTLRWPGKQIPELPDALPVLLKPSKSYAYAANKNAIASITILLRDLGTTDR